MLIGLYLILLFQVEIEFVERFAFYDRAKTAYAIVHTGYVSQHSLLYSSHWSCTYTKDHYFIAKIITNLVPMHLAIF